MCELFDSVGDNLRLIWKWAGVTIKSSLTIINKKSSYLGYFHGKIGSGKLSSDYSNITNEPNNAE